MAFKVYDGYGRELRGGTRVAVTGVVEGIYSNEPDNRIVKVHMEGYDEDGNPVAYPVMVRPQDAAALTMTHVQQIQELLTRP